MTPEELKKQLEAAVELGKKAETRIEEQQKTISGLVEKIEATKAKYEAVQQQLKDGGGNAEEVKSLSEKLSELTDELSDVRSKMKTPVQSLTSEDQKKALREVAFNAYNDFIKNVKSTNQTDFGLFIKSAEDQFKTLNISSPETGGRAVAEILSMDLIEYSREYSPVLTMIGRRTLSRDYRELVLNAYPAVSDGIENVAGTDFEATATQEYGEVKSDVIKVMADAPITDEAMSGTDYNVYSDLVRLLGDQVGVTLAAKVLYGNGSGKNGRGMLSSSRIDITDVTGESFKPTMGTGARSADVYPAYPTGVSGALGADDSAIVDLMINLHNTLPTKYLKGASYVMNRNTKSVLEKVRDTDGKPIFKFNFIEGDTIRLNGYPVVLDDTYPDIAADSTPITFGDHSKAFAMSNGDIDYMQLNPYKKQGLTYVEYNKEIFTIMQQNDAILVVACTANGPSAV